MEKYIFTGKSEEEALSEGLKSLSVSKDDVYYKTNEQKGGLFKAKKYDVEIIKKSDVNDFM